MALSPSAALSMVSIRVEGFCCSIKETEKKAIFRAGQSLRGELGGEESRKRGGGRRGGGRRGGGRRGGGRRGGSGKKKLSLSVINCLLLAASCHFSGTFLPLP